jgi:assimilatory nitrate reductase catalytic subunit
MSAIRTTCPYCGVGCGLAVTNGVPNGDPEHPANFGRLCSKGMALKDTLELPDRLLSPQIGGRASDWNEALDLVAAQFSETLRKHGPDSIAFYVSGQLLTEDYYVANKLVKGFLGSANIDTNSRLCMASSVAGHARAFGEDIVPGCYEDLDEADLAVLAGSNTAWCHPILYQRLIAAREKRGTKIVVIDPRRTATCETADLHLPLKTGSDIALFNGLLVHLARSGGFAAEWIARHISGAEETLHAAEASAPSLESVATATGLACDDILHFYRLFARTERTVTMYSQGVNQSVVGTDKVNAILNCHLATGRIGRPGMGPFSLTGQPNAMGGREVGGLANQLAAHMAFAAEDVDRVRRFWNAPNIAKRSGLKAVDMFKAVGDGRIKAIWIVATNPAASMPNADAVRKALEYCPFVAVSDAWATDTTARAHVVLPAATWAEKDGTVTNSERRISRQRAFLAAPGAARPDWWMFAEVARRMGWEREFSYPNPAAIFREHAALSAFENGGKRIFDIGALADRSDTGYEALEPVQWPCSNRGGSAAAQRLFTDGLFPTPDGRARMVPVAAGRSKMPSGGIEVTLNTGRVRDQWHTMTRTGRVPHLMTHASEPLLAIHPCDAAARGIAAGGLVQVKNERGDAVMRAHLTEAQQPGAVFAPMHWTDQFASAGTIGRLVHDETDPISGQPDLKGSTVRLCAIETLWHGLLLTRGPALPDLGGKVFWSKAPAEAGFAFTLAGWSDLALVIHSETILRRLLQIPNEAELVSYSDPKKSIFRYAGFLGSRLEACLSLAPSEGGLLSRHSVPLFLGRSLDAAERLSLLAPHSGKPGISPDKVVCSCFSVGADAITGAIRSGNLKTVKELGAALQAGTNCGSCIPELTRLLRNAALQPAL